MAVSRIVSRVKIARVMRVRGRLMASIASAELPIRCMSRWPAVMLAVRRTAKASG